MSPLRAKSRGNDPGSWLDLRGTPVIISHQSTADQHRRRDPVPPPADRPHDPLTCGIDRDRSCPECRSAWPSSPLEPERITRWAEACRDPRVRRGAARNGRVPIDPRDVVTDAWLAQLRAAICLPDVRAWLLDLAAAEEGQ